MQRHGKTSLEKQGTITLRFPVRFELTPRIHRLSRFAGAKPTDILSC